MVLTRWFVTEESTSLRIFEPLGSGFEASSLSETSLDEHSTD